MSWLAVIGGILSLVSTIAAGVSSNRSSSSSGTSSTDGSASTSTYSGWNVASDVLSSGSSLISSLSTQSQYQSYLAHQEEREDTAYQRAVADMQAAGINPASAFSGSGSASTSSSSYDPEAYLRAMQITSGINLTNAQASLARAQARQASSQSDLDKANENKINEEIPTIKPSSDANIVSLLSSAYESMEKGKVVASNAEANQSYLYSGSYRNVEEGKVVGEKANAYIEQIHQECDESMSRIGLNEAQRNKIVVDSVIAMGKYPEEVKLLQAQFDKLEDDILSNIMSRSHTAKLIEKLEYDIKNQSLDYSWLSTYGFGTEVLKSMSSADLQSLVALFGTNVVVQGSKMLQN